MKTTREYSLAYGISWLFILAFFAWTVNLLINIQNDWAQSNEITRIDQDVHALFNPWRNLNRPGNDFSFSGLKTAVMLEVRKAREDDRLDRVRADIAASFQRAAVDTLVGKTLRAAKSTGLDRIVVAGGVARHLSKFLTDKETIDRFATVWPQGDFLQHIPIRLLVNPLAPLVGAAAHYLQSEK